MKKTVLLLFVIISCVCLVASGQSRKRQQGKSNKAQTTATVVGHTYECDNYGGNTMNSMGARLSMTVTFVSNSKVILESYIAEHPTGIFNTPEVNARLSQFESEIFNGTKRMEKRGNYYVVMDSDGEVITQFSPRKGGRELVEKDTNNLFKRIK